MVLNSQSGKQKGSLSPQKYIHGNMVQLLINFYVRLAQGELENGREIFIT